MDNVISVIETFATDMTFIIPLFIITAICLAILYSFPTICHSWIYIGMLVAIGFAIYRVVHYGICDGWFGSCAKIAQSRAHFRQHIALHAFHPGADPYSFAIYLPEH
jgi:hypothetical protein